MQKLKEWIKSLFEDKSYQDHIDYYIASKNPKSTAEVEYWIRHYDQHQRGASL